MHGWMLPVLRTDWPRGDQSRNQEIGWLRPRSIKGLVILATLCWLTGLFGAAIPARAQSDSQQQFITDLYQSYFQRTPGLREINEWTGWFRQGSSAEEIHASIISSEEFFNLVGRDADRFVTNVFRIVNGRNPSAQEFSYWRQRLLANGMDRRKYGLEFLKSMGNRRPGSDWGQPTNDVQPLARQLASQSRSLLTSVNREIPWSNTVVRMQVSSLVAASARLQGAAERNDTRNISIAFQDVQSAVSGMESSLRRQSGAFSSQLYLNQIQRTSQQIASRLGYNQWPGTQLPSIPGSGFPVLPPIQNNSPWSPTQRRQLDRYLHDLGSEVSSLYYLLRDLSQYDNRYQNLVTDMQWYSSRVNQMSSDIQRGTDIRSVRQSYRQLVRQAENFEQRIRGEQVDVRLRQGLFQVSQTLYQIGAIVGVGNAGGNAGGIPGTRPDIPNRQELLAEVNRAIAVCDRLIAVYSSYVLYGRPVQVYLADLRNTRQQLVVLRNAMMENADPLQIRTDVSAVVSSVSNLQGPWAQFSQSVRSVDSNDMNALTTSASRLRSLSQ